MIPRLILIAAILLGIFYLRQKILAAPVAQRKSLMWKYGLIGVAILLVGLAAIGRVHWIGALIAATLPFIRRFIPLLIRYFPLLQHFYKTQQGQQGPTAGQQSNVETSTLTMTMDHDSGHLHGQVISGPFSGRQLDQMSQEELLSLFDYCQRQDNDAASLLASYLNHRFGDSWQQASPAAGDSTLDETEALKLLGLEEGASEEEIVQAHRRLMQKLHPDRGGSDYLAAKINQAKDLLLARSGR